MIVFLYLLLQKLLVKEFMYNVTKHPIRTAIIGSFIGFFVYIQLQDAGIKSIDNATSAIVDLMYDTIEWALMNVIEIMALPFVFLVHFFKGFTESLVEKSTSLTTPDLEFNVNTEL